MAICGAGKIIAYRPHGTTERVLAMPCVYPASVTFRGEDWGQLFVTCLDTRFLGEPKDKGGATFVILGLGASGIPDIRYGR